MPAVDYAIHVRGRRRFDKLRGAYLVEARDLIQGLFIGAHDLRLIYRTGMRVRGSCAEDHV